MKNANRYLIFDLQFCYAVDVIIENGQTTHVIPTQPFIMCGLKTKEKITSKNYIAVRILAHLPMY